MPYKIKGKCIYKKSGQKVGCTKGDVRKYMKALQANVKEDVSSDKSLKFEFKYLNGGFSSEGVKITPGDVGKLNIEISIYGGGRKKSLGITAPKSLQSLLQGYTAAQKQNDAKNGDVVGEELQSQLETLSDSISQRLIALFEKVDAEVKQILKESFNEL